MATINLRVEDKLKEQSEQVFKAIGMTPSEAIRVFLTQCVNSGGLPFRPISRQPNAETLAALNEHGGAVYKDVEELSELWRS